MSNEVPQSLLEALYDHATELGGVPAAQYLNYIRPIVSGYFKSRQSQLKALSPLAKSEMQRGNTYFIVASCYMDTRRFNPFPVREIVGLAESEVIAGELVSSTRLGDPLPDLATMNNSVYKSIGATGVGRFAWPLSRPHHYAELLVFRDQVAAQAALDKYNKAPRWDPPRPIKGFAPRV